MIWNPKDAARYAVSVGGEEAIRQAQRDLLPECKSDGIRIEWAQEVIRISKERGINVK